MLRNLQIKPNKPVMTTYKTEVKMSTGMGVVKDYAANTVGFPDAETATNIFIVDKERIATGINAGRGELSDYEPEFNTLEIGEFVKLQEPESGERRAVDQYVDTGLVEGVAMSVGTDGKWKKATAGMKSKFVYAGKHTSDGHDLAIIEIVNDAIENV